MFYKNRDYTKRMTVINGHNRYFIKYHSLTYTPEQEIKLDTFMLYLKEFNKPLERQKNEQRRHFEDVDIDYLVATGKLTAFIVESDSLTTKYAIESALDKCTPIQQRRFVLHYLHEYSFTEIAKIEKCDEAAIFGAFYRLRRSEPLKQIQDWLGHSDFAITANIYAHLDFSAKQATAEAMTWIGDTSLAGALENTMPANPVTTGV
jgi:predicted DNA-binding protein YlxM (UPF0122 family)